MKYLSLIFILIFAFSIFGQNGAPSNYKGQAGIRAPYINTQYNFAFAPPSFSKPDEEFNKTAKFIASYSCPATVCAGTFSLVHVEPFNATLKDAVKDFQQKETQKFVAKDFLSGFKPENYATVLSKHYAAYNGRPAVRIDYNFTKGERSFSGAFIGMFVEEKNILVSFASIAPDWQSEHWTKLCEDAIRSFSLLPETIKPLREGILTVIGTYEINTETPKPASGGVMNGKATFLPKPPYPAAARAVRTSGVVNVQVTIDENGNVISASPVSGHPLLWQASEKAAYQAKFSPTYLYGQRVKVTGVIVYNYINP